MAPVAVSETPVMDRKTIMVVGLGMVGIGEQPSYASHSLYLYSSTAFIEKMLALDEEKRYRIVTCGEEIHLAYNRVRN
jgi:nitrite reductase (NAD(P)H)